MNSSDIFSPTLTEEPINWYAIKASTDDFKILNTFVCDSGSDLTDEVNYFKKNLMKLSLLNHSKRVPVNGESSVLKNYIFRLINQNQISSSEVAQACMNFILDEKYLNKIILEINMKGNVINYYTDLGWL